MYYQLSNDFVETSVSSAANDDYTFLLGLDLGETRAVIIIVAWKIVQNLYH